MKFISGEICKKENFYPFKFDSPFSTKHGKNAEHEGETIGTHIRIDQHVAETENATSSQLGKLVIATSQNIDIKIAKLLTREKENLGDK